jgi:CO/xanthine dehydrogenase Mo-binding subunit
MSNHPSYMGPVEPNGDELPSRSDIRFNFHRRKFFKIFGGGLAVAFVLKDMLSFAGEESTGYLYREDDGQVNAWIHIGEDGTVTVYTGKVEVGQNIRTSLSQLVAEELHVPLSSIKMLMGDTDLVPYDMGTFGSRTTPTMGPQLRKAAATAREELLQMAAKKWNADAASLQAKDGMVVNSSKNLKVSYGELTKGQELILPISDTIQLTPATDWKVAGKTVSKVDARAFLTGKHQYVSDRKLPGMLYGKIVRPPSFNAKIISADLSKAQAIPGIVAVHDGNFIGVAAPDLATASRGLQAIDVNWQELTSQPSNANIFDYLVKNTSDERQERNSGIVKGNVEDALKAAEVKLNRTYHVNYIAHVPLEPRAAVAEWKDGKLTVWTGTQRPFAVRDELVSAFRVPKEKVRVIMPDTGSGYGGKHTGETAIEAARLAQAAGKPVKVVWTREEEFTNAYFRPAGVIEVNSGFNKDGSISAWKFTNYNSGPAALSVQYKIPNQQIKHVPCNSPLRQGSYRGLAGTANVFARESHISDMARLVNMDQLEFRLKNSDDPRLSAVLQAAATKFGWKTAAKEKGAGYGIACAFEKGGHVATCAEVRVNGDREVKIIRLVQAFECGAIVNPHHLENQIMGSIIQGLGGALFESVDFADGKILNSSMSAYRVPRISDVPKIDVVLVDRKDLPSAGAGEAGIFGVAPAIRNAIADAEGIALTTLPLLPNLVL